MAGGSLATTPFTSGADTQSLDSQVNSLHPTSTYCDPNALRTLVLTHERQRALFLEGSPSSTGSTQHATSSKTKAQKQ